MCANYKSISITEIEKSSKKSKKTEYLGVSAAFLSALLGSVKGLLVNKLSYIGAIEIFGVRSLGTTLIILPYLIYSKEKIFRDFTTNVWLFLAAIVSNIAVTGYYYGFAYLPMGIASAIYYSCPLYTTILSFVFLKEACGVVEILSVGLILIGLVFVTSPWELIGGYSYSIPGLVGSITGAVAQAIAFLMIRKLKDIPAIVITVWWSVVGTIVPLIKTFSTNTFEITSCGMDGVFAVGIAFLGTFGSLSMNLALAKCEAGTVSIVLTSEIVFGFILQVFLENLPLETLSVIGGGLIMLAFIGMYFVKRFENEK